MAAFLGRDSLIYHFNPISKQICINFKCRGLNTTSARKNLCIILFPTSTAPWHNPSQSLPDDYKSRGIQYWIYNRQEV